MEYSKDNFYEMSFNKKINRLQFGQAKWVNKVIDYTKKHILLTTVLFSFFLFSTVNIIMIFNFMKILQNI